MQNGKTLTAIIRKFPAHDMADQMRPTGGINARCTVSMPRHRLPCSETFQRIWREPPQ